MKVAILGATSRIAQDLISEWDKKELDAEIYLYARNLESLDDFTVSLAQCYQTRLISKFPEVVNYDVIINFIGVGDPAKTRDISNSIIDITTFYDEIVISYLKKNKNCKYIFMSSGAVYGSGFTVPVNKNTKALYNVNQPSLYEMYGMAKLVSEFRHRALSDLKIFDLRIFNYFSSKTDLNSRFFITDMCRALLNEEIFIVEPTDMIRDFIDPSDFSSMIDCLLVNENSDNIAIDCYSKSHVTKFEILEYFTEVFELNWKLSNDAKFVDATGIKSNYYSLNRTAELYGYIPKYTSLQSLHKEVEKIISRNNKII